VSRLISLDANRRGTYQRRHQLRCARQDDTLGSFDVTSAYDTSLGTDVHMAPDDCPKGSGIVVPELRTQEMYSAPLKEENWSVCKKFMQNPLEIYVDDEKRLTLHGLQQFYMKLDEGDQKERLNDLLDSLEFNQAIIFVRSTLRCTELDKLLCECNFSSTANPIHRVNKPDRKMYLVVTSM
jgi:hypothetical protein